jgi:tetratricopeptide (TPR) repeat protein
LSPAPQTPRARGESAPRAAPAPLTLPLVAAALVAAACITVSVSFRIADPDLWQNLVVGKAIWTLHGVPTTQLWTWPTLGAPDVNWTWGFSALLWPVWAHGGVFGLYAWRWITTLAAFGLLWAAARTMGARGFLPLIVMVLCSLTWRLRSQARPDTLVAVLLALTVWILETRRAGGRDRTPWLIATQWAWANVHNSYFIGFTLIGLHALDGWLAPPRRAAPVGHGAAAARGRRAGASRLFAIGLAALAISFVNPFGWRLLWQPFDFFLHHRNDPVFLSIGELRPVDWSVNWKSGLPLLFVGWPVLVGWRARRSGLDRVEFVACALFTALALNTQRFAGFYSLLAAPFVARDLDSCLARPGWLARAPGATRAALAALACVVIGLPEWSREELPLAIGLDWRNYPVAACDFMAAHDVRGRGFNQFGNAGYQLYRFWPDPGRLPFMDIHQAGTPVDRYLYAFAQQRGDAWRELDHRHRFDYAVLSGLSPPKDSLLDVLDADTTWALVFKDDVAVLFVRRGGTLDSIARGYAYRELPAGMAAIEALGAACARDSARRARVAAELEREVAGSPRHSRALIMLSNLALLENRLDDARELVEAAIALDRFRAGAHLRLGAIALEQGRPRDALREFGHERVVSGPMRGLELQTGCAYLRLGDPAGARAAYGRELRRFPDNAEARDSLAALARAGAL